MDVGPKEFGVLGLGFRVSGLGVRGLGVRGLGVYWFWGFGLRIWGGFGVLDLGFRSLGLWGLRNPKAQALRKTRDQKTNAHKGSYCWWGIV